MLKRCGCIILVIVIILVIALGALFGVLYWGYGKFIKPTLGVGFFDAISMISGMYKFDEADIVTHPYDPEADLADFNDSFKLSFGLSDDYLAQFGLTSDDLDVSKILSGEFLENFDTSILPDDFVNNYVEPGKSIEDYIPEGFDPQNPPENFNPEDYKHLLTSTSRNLSYSGAVALDGTGTILPGITVPDNIEVTDRQLAAVAQSYFENYISDSANLQGLQSALNGIDISQLLRIMQLVIVNDGQQKSEDLEIRLTARASILLLFDSYAPSEIPAALKKMLPEYFYLTITVFPGNPLKPGTVHANSFNEKQTTSLNTMLDTISQSSGGLDYLLIKFNATVSELLGSLETYKIPLKFIKSV